MAFDATRTLCEPAWEPTWPLMAVVVFDSPRGLLGAHVAFDGTRSL